jgi:hypothetical protein
VRLVELQNPQPPNAPCCPPPDFSGYEFGATCTDAGGCVRWVGTVGDYYEHQDRRSLGGFRGARLQCTPHYADWALDGPFYIAGAEIVPSSMYVVEQLAASCAGLEDTCGDLVQSWSLATTRHGDVVGLFNPPSTTSQPDALDVAALVNHFRHLPGAPHKPSAQLQPNLPELNLNVSALDIAIGVDAFRGNPYALSGPCPCPSTVLCAAIPCTTAGSCSGGLCVRSCVGGSAGGLPCLSDAHCPSGVCGSGFCRDRCGRCSP